MAGQLEEIKNIENKITDASTSNENSFDQYSNIKFQDVEVVDFSKSVEDNHSGQEFKSVNVSDSYGVLLDVYNTQSAR